MYAASVLFLLVAVGALVTGFFQSGLTFVYASIGASVVAGLFLLLGVLRKRSIVVATAGAPYEPPPWIGPTAEPEAAPRSEPATAPRVTPGVAPPPLRPAPGSTPAPVRPSSGRRPVQKAAPPARKQAPARPAPSHRTKTATTRKPAAKKAPARRPAAKKAPARKPAAARPSRGGAIAPGGRVIVTERGTYHRPSCRMVTGKSDLESSTRKSAEEEGYSPCGICKPATATSTA